MKEYKIFVLMFVLFSCKTTALLANGLEVNNGKLFFNNVEVPTNISFKGYQENSEKKVLFSHLSSDRYSIVKVIPLNDRVEFWLFDAAYRDFQHVNTYPANFAVSWLSDNVFLLERKSMGTSVSILNVIQDNKQVLSSGYVTDFVAFDSDLLLILSLSSDDERLVVSNFSYTKHVTLSKRLEIKRAFDSKLIKLERNSSNCELQFKDPKSANSYVKLLLSEADCDSTHKLNDVR